MKRFFSVIGAVVFACLAASAEPRAARPQVLLAYTDPGSGALLFQYLTMGGLFIAFYFSRARIWLAKRLGWSRAETETSNESADSRPEDSGNGETSRPGRVA